MIGWIFCLIFLAACLLMSREWFRAKEEINELASDRQRLQASHDVAKSSWEYWREQCKLATNELNIANENYRTLRASTAATIADLESKVNRLEGELFRANETVTSRTNFAQRLDSEYNARTEELDEAKVEIEALRHELATAREFGDQVIRLKEKIREGLNSKRPNWKKLFEGESL